MPQPQRRESFALQTLSGGNTLTHLHHEVASPNSKSAAQTTGSERQSQSGIHFEDYHGYSMTDISLAEGGTNSPDSENSPPGTPKESSDEPDAMSIISQLPPVDRGRGAWIFLIVGFIVEGVCWGLPFSYGVFLNHYADLPEFADSKGLSLIGTLASGIPYLASPLMFMLINMFPHHRKNMMWFGLLLTALACVASSFATRPWHLIVTQGVLYGIGTNFLYSPTFSMLNEWFMKRRGLAYGVMFAGTGISGLFLPLIFEKLLTSYGHATALRAWSVAMILLTAPALYFCKTRIPSSSHSSAAVRRKQTMDFSFLKSRVFHILALANLCQGLGYFLPGIYLPSYAADLHLPAIQSTILLSLLNLASVFGQIGIGFFSDKFDVYNVAFVSTSVSALAVYLLWGMSKTFGMLLAFALVYGVFAGGYSVLWTRFAMRVSGEENNALTLTLIGVFSFGRGIGNILAGPISEALVQSGDVLKNPAGNYGYGLRKYESMVIFVGAAMVISCLGISGKLVKH